MARAILKTLGLAGAALTAWYFLDPKKGSERRDNFKKSAIDLYDSASEELTRISKDVATGVTDTVSKVSQMTGLGGNGNGSGTQKADKTSTQDAAASRSENFSAPLSA